MINVRVEHQKTGKFTDSVINAAVDGFSKILIRELKDKKCELHPSANNYVIIRAVNNSMIATKHFCCKDFESKIQINLKG